MYKLYSLEDIIQYASGDTDSPDSSFEFEDEDIREDSFEFTIHVTDQVVSAVRTISNLRKVSLCGIECQPAFITALNHNNKLEVLILSSGLKIGLGCICALGRILSNQHSVLKELHITHGSCNDDVIGCLYYDLSKSTSLKMLSLQDNNGVDDDPITDRGFQMLSEILASPNSALAELDLSDCDITHAGNTELFSGLTTYSRLQKLVLSRNKIDLTNATRLSAGLKSNSVLLSLDLSGCLIDNSSAKTLADGLAGNTSLKKLLMYDVGENITPSTWSIVLFSLRISNMPLETLDLSHNNISDETCDDIIAVLIGKKDTLVSFNVESVNMTQAGWKMLVNEFRNRMPKLKYVTAGNRHFDDDLAIALVEGLKDQPSFASLCLYNPNLTDIGHEAIRPYL
jgi:Ran GTPase-activating protein (RanGAP) involved in mRNA processing and transport